ncbi:MAG: hypothetical protein JWQ65_2985 [Devosia sp.]|nr:hypothetical protein [Devosia sp.]
MSLRFAVPLLCLLLPSLAAAQPRPMPPSADPHMTGYDQSGSFTVNFYGTRPDGTLCPPSVNALSITISDEQTITGLHLLSVDKQTDPALAALFDGGACRISFDGEASIRIHHGTAAYIAPTAARAEGGAPRLTGRIKITYIPIMCLVPPCPPGNYMLADDTGQLLGQVDAILIDDAESGDKTILRGRYPDWSRAEASVWFDDTTRAEMLQFEEGERRARIHLTHIIEDLAP